MVVHLCNILKFIELYTFKQVNCRVCKFCLSKAVIYKRQKKMDRIRLKRGKGCKVSRLDPYIKFSLMDTHN